MATTELKPGGYQRFVQIGDKLDAMEFKPFTGVDVAGIEALALAARSDKYHVKAVKPLPRRKLYEKVCPACSIWLMQKKAWNWRRERPLSGKS